MICIPSIYMEILKNMKASEKYICESWNRLAVHFKHINDIRLVDETWEDQDEGVMRCNNTRGRNGRFA
jgi:hypothetical protein